MQSNIQINWEALIEQVEIVVKKFFLINLFLLFSTLSLASQLPIKGKCFRLDYPFLVYFPEGPKEIWVYNLETGSNEKVPNSENRFSRDHVFPSIATDGNIVAVTWCENNTAIWYSEKQVAGGQWSSERIIQDNGSGPDTNRNSVSINPLGVMVTAQSDYAIKSRFKPHGRSWAPIVNIRHDQPSEPALPQVKSFGNKFVAAYTCDCGGIGSPLKRRTVQLATWSGSWSIGHTFEIEGAPDSLTLWFDNQGNAHVSVLEWCDEEREYCRVIYCHNSTQEVIFEKTKMGTLENPPFQSIATDISGNILLGYCHYRSGDTCSYLFSSHSGGGIEKISSEPYTAIDYHGDYFHLIYIAGNGFIWHDSITYGPIPPTNTPSFTPTFTNTPTLQPTNTFTPTAIPTDTFTPEATATFTATNTYTATPTFTNTPTNTPTAIPTPDYECIEVMGCVICPKHSAGVSSLASVFLPVLIGIMVLRRKR